MRRGALEAESLALGALAAFPLYFTGVVSPVAIGAFHLVLLLMIVAALRGRSGPALPPFFLRLIAIAYLFFFFVDGIAISRSLIRASTHLLLFIFVYLAAESEWRGNFGKRLLVTLMMFTASIATATDLSVVGFVVVFGFLGFRQMIHISHWSTWEGRGASTEAPASRPAVFYAAATSIVAVFLFPVLPRVRNPVVRGISSPVGNATTGLSDTIDFSLGRSISPNSQVVARISMPQQLVPFFAPIRLRGRVYDAYRRGVWRSAVNERPKFIDPHSGSYIVGRRKGLTGTATIQQQFSDTSRLFLPSGTFMVSGVGGLVQSPRPGFYFVPMVQGGVSYEAVLSTETLPLEDETRAPLVNYPISPEVAAMAKRLAGAGGSATVVARRIESHMSRVFHYIPDPAALGRPATLDEFLLKTHRGHCEYFAAGMVVLLRALNIPARIVGGFYGGELNPLTGYFIVRQRDAHAWVEVFDGERWVTYDPTPPSMRPGNAGSGFFSAYASALGDSITYFWDRYVLTFGLGDQVTILMRSLDFLRKARAGSLQTVRRMVAAIRPLPVAEFLVGAFFLFALLKRLRLRTVPIFTQLDGRLRRLGIEVSPAMTAGEIVDVVGSQRPDLVPTVGFIAGIYTRERFARARPSAGERAAARKAIRELKR